MNSNVVLVNTTTNDKIWLEKQEMKKVTTIREIAKKGYITSKEVAEQNIENWFLYDFVKKNNYQKLAPGFYASKKWDVDNLVIFQYQYPRFIYSFHTALYLHDLCEINLCGISVTGPKNYRPFSPKGGIAKVHTDTKDKTYNIGVIKVKTMYGNYVTCYDKEKTICDLIANKSTFEAEWFYKAIKNYFKSKDVNYIKLSEYANAMRITDKVRDIIEFFLNE